jgi:hypothetical protein
MARLQSREQATAAEDKGLTEVTQRRAKQGGADNHPALDAAAKGDKALRAEGDIVVRLKQPEARFVDEEVGLALSAFRAPRLGTVQLHTLKAI